MCLFHFVFSVFVFVCSCVALTSNMHIELRCANQTHLHSQTHRYSDRLGATTAAVPTAAAAAAAVVAATAGRKVAAAVVAVPAAAAVVQQEALRRAPVHRRTVQDTAAAAGRKVAVAAVSVVVAAAAAAAADQDRIWSHTDTDEVLARHQGTYPPAQVALSDCTAAAARSPLCRHRTDHSGRPTAAAVHRDQHHCCLPACH
jgi:hypothetical protein